MVKIVDHPLLVFAISFLGLWLSAWLGAFLLRKQLLHEGVREDFGLVLASTLTLLGLIIGFSFSMATSRYDQRKNYEAAEANAIGTEYVRADLLPAADGAKVRALLKRYLDERILYYTTRGEEEVGEIDVRTADLQAELWSAIRAPARANPNPVMALVVSGMNDVLNAQSYTQAAWWNRIPGAAWLLMAANAEAAVPVCDPGINDLSGCCYKYPNPVFVAGTSAGATAMGRTMILGGEGPEVSAAAVRTGPGLGLLPRMLIDMHFAERGRLPRLLSAVALHRIAFGLLLIVAFSVGLAAVLVGVGLLLVSARGAVQRWNGEGRWLEYLPFLSPLVITPLGVVIAVRSLLSTGLLSGLSF